MVDKFEGLPYRVKTVFKFMVSEPSLRKHIILTGPPGSGKTTSAKQLVEAFYGDGAFSRSLFLNSSDERGLEAVRSRVYPFIRSSLHMLFNQVSGTKPKIIIFDEAETLTDQAQMALRPLLDEDPNSVIIIFLCNSISRIHPSIVHKFLILQLESPIPADFKNRYTKILDTSISNIDILFRRGDIRYFLLNVEKKDECQIVWKKFMNAHKSEVSTLIEQTLKTWMFHDLAMYFFFIAKLLDVLSVEAAKAITYYTDPDFLKLCPHSIRVKLLSDWFQTYILSEKIE